MDLRSYQGRGDAFSQLSLTDLLDAREQYHVHLMRHPNVVATAIGRYRIRNQDSWPSDKGPGKVHGKGRRTLENSSVRPYSWPAILVFVSQWVDEAEFAARHGRYAPDELVPRTLYLPDGRSVPVCVVEAPRLPANAESQALPRFPRNNLGGGYPVIADVQGRRHLATIACLVSDGHKAYALTNRHVTGDAGEVLSSVLDGREKRIGVTAPRQLTRMPFGELYPGWAGTSVYANLDVGLIDIDDLGDWTARVRDAGTLGPLVDLSVANISLSLIGARVSGTGAASGRMEGEIHGLFYRYKSQGGFEYVADLFIGPRMPLRGEIVSPPLATHPGDSGTLWLLDPHPAAGGDQDAAALPRLPLAMQWGENTLHSGEPGRPQSHVLASLLGRVCERLEVDLVRDWNLDQPDTWGALGHFTIAARTLAASSGDFPGLDAMMSANLLLFTHDDATLATGDFKGMGSATFVPLADVPDFYWKHGSQGASRHFEGPNHFADMDHPRPGDQATLLDLCNADPANIDPDVWNAFYDSVEDLLTGEPIRQENRGLLPFRVWQIFDEMVAFAADAKTHDRFVCAAGVLTHYVGDACQPLHISYLHDGDPLQATVHTVHHVKGAKAGTSEDVKRPLGQGVHSAYEDRMVDDLREKILEALRKTPKVKPASRIATGFEAAVQTVALMTRTFRAIPPRDIVEAYAHPPQGTPRAQHMQDTFGDRTIAVMKDGTHLAALLWESAWAAGQGEAKAKPAKALTRKRAMQICADPDFLASCSIGEIAARLDRS